MSPGQFTPGSLELPNELLVLPPRVCFLQMMQVVQHSRRVLSEDGVGVVLQPVTYKVDIKAGQLEGTHFVFAG